MATFLPAFLQLLPDANKAPLFLVGNDPFPFDFSNAKLCPCNTASAVFPVIVLPVSMMTLKCLPGRPALWRAILVDLILPEIRQMAGRWPAKANLGSILDGPVRKPSSRRSLSAAFVWRPPTGCVFDAR